MRAPWLLWPLIQFVILRYKLIQSQENATDCGTKNYRVRLCVCSCVLRIVGGDGRRDIGSCNIWVVWIVSEDDVASFTWCTLDTFFFYYHNDS